MSSALVVALSGFAVLQACFVRALIQDMFRCQAMFRFSFACLDIYFGLWFVFLFYWLLVAMLARTVLFFL